MEEIYFLSETAIKGYYEELFYSEDNNWDIFILINRKGYWDYKIFFPDGVKLKDEQKIYSDRYMEKTPLNVLDKMFFNKNVILYDDSITNGSNLFYYYLLCKYVGAKDIRPCVYACNTSFPSDDAKKLMIRESRRINQEFWEKQDKTPEDIMNEYINKLEFKIQLGNRDIERLSVWQTEFFQKNVSPLVMDLPILNHIDGEEKAFIKLKKEDFEKLRNKKTKKWVFVDNIYKEMRMPIKASYFRFYKEELINAFPYVAHDFIVKCKYEYEQDYVKVVFTPFAMFKSISYEKILEAFDLLYHDTKYEETIKDEFKDVEDPVEKLEEDANLCKGLFRAIIYRISHYIGWEFREFVKKELDKQIEFDMEIMHDNYDQSFIDTVQKWNEENAESEFLNAISGYRDEELRITRKYKCYSRYKVDAKQELVCNHLRSRVISKKKSVTSTLEERIYVFEEIEKELDDFFVFESSKEKQHMITNACIMFLETNSFSNYLLENRYEHILYRGFRYGENSEVFLHEDLWFFYIFLYAYYETCPRNELLDCYEIYMRKFKIFLEKKGYLNVLISEEGFDFLKEYFGNFKTEDKLEEEIRRRRYLMDYDKTIIKNQVKEFFIKEASLVGTY